MQSRVLRDVIVVLALKLAALTAIYLLFFGPAHQPRLDAPRMADRVLGADPSQTRR